MTDEYGTDIEAPEASEETTATSPDDAGLSDVTGEANEQLEGLQRDLDALNERHLRLAAEFDNYRKRIDRERAELWTRAQAELVKGLLESLDDLQRVSSIDIATTSVEALAEGILLIEKKLRHALETAGLEPVQAEGEFFNPVTMEAVMTVEAEDPEEDDAVADVFQKGYRFKDQLIRPARVRVKKYGQL